jgi:hypothetical protein
MQVRVAQSEKSFNPKSPYFNTGIEKIVKNQILSRALCDD